MPRTVIVGSGLAAHATASALAAGGYAGEVVVVGAERHAPYDRPPLSKDFLAGRIARADLALGHVPAGLLAGSAAVALDAEKREVALADGSVLAADDVVIATGAAARRLPGAHAIDTIDDAEALRSRLVPGARVVVAGSSFLGLEAAATAAGLGCAVTVVCPEAAPLARRFGPEAAAAIRALHERAGVAFASGARVTGIGADGSVALDGGGALAADVVIAAMGSRPATAWLAGSGLDAADGVACDADGLAAPGIRAAGDCAVWAGEGCGHWTRAREQGAHVAREILGIAHPPAAVPYLWSDQHGVRIQFAGTLAGGERAVVTEGSAETGDLLLTYLRGADEVAVLGMSRSRAVTRWRRTRAARPLAAAA